jgi:broad specificity phosphatase PhoE
MQSADRYEDVLLFCLFRHGEATSHERGHITAEIVDELERRGLEEAEILAALARLEGKGLVRRAGERSFINPRQAALRLHQYDYAVDHPVPESGSRLRPSALAGN